MTERSGGSFAVGSPDVWSDNNASGAAIEDVVDSEEEVGGDSCGEAGQALRFFGATMAIDGSDKVMVVGESTTASGR
jgi:hypothetical protein